MKTCVVPGSFDPFTIGHLDMVERAAKMFDKVYVAIMANSEKKGTFDLATRKKIAEVSCGDLKNVTVITAEGLLAELCVALGAVAIVKGVRNVADYSYEADMADINRHLAPIDTVWLPARPSLAFISSTFVRELIKYERPLDGAMHPDALHIIEAEMIKK
ncbi:MAG: pantetheine-phosphate adenylyltransferase [Clostridia bacterium]|nr:pantetheine-phosphate adenylyltransferase [Clostridia bacterium]